MRLLLIEDDAETGNAVVAALRAHGHAVDWETNGQGGLDRAATDAYALLVVDRMLPGIDGLSLVAELRQRQIAAPVLMLTALGSIEQRVEGLEGGADDYLVKPFAIAELLARIEALQRRAAGPPSILSLGDLTLDRLARTVRRGDTPIELIPREFQLLELLMLNSPAVLTRLMLLETVWKFRFDPGRNLVESHISRLRTKIDRGGDPPLIHTMRGEGYAAWSE
ncbi:response regulator transcription factor [Sphingomonas sp. TX0522]|uniref:response regulator transcription factor n=1 Tax=Sphingomonas sp. TX0522 TaxID=2479205 RepID=UPI0018E005AB|nr:response regulator transcription factor [Sphingomonas sp. TX0522]MBI0533767.1 DNA-binding response regulator [Sphingomonas sp. TX0522]